ncbi:MAG: hypothetical protein ONB15_06300 [candidate division KSB1 bacterium]|nr:hypothetical protein [candidate division KSB1 bacterium]
MRRLAWLTVALFLTGTALTEEHEDFASYLQWERAAGILSPQQELVLRVLAMVNPEALPEPYRSLPRKPGKCGTMTMWEVKSRWHELNTVQQQTLAPYVSRPTLPQSLVSPTGHFKIHYTTSPGADQTTEEFAHEAAVAFDKAWQVEVDELGYPPPPPDFGIDGPEYDVYIQNISDYGWTYPELPVVQTEESDWTTYIVVDNDYSRGFYTKGLDGLRVTAAHEFFHAIHFGIREPFREPESTADLFYYEVSATWMEDVVWDHINDYYNYLGDFFRTTHLPFNSTDGRREYGMAVWNHFVAKRVGPEAIRDSWLAMKGMHGLQAIRQALLPRGLTLEDALGEFALWNAFTGSRADTIRFYPEGAHYPQVRFHQHLVLEERVDVADSCRRMATKYYLLLPQLPAPYGATLISSDPSRWRLSLAVFGPTKGNGDFSPGGAFCSLGHLAPVDTVVVAASRTNLADQDLGLGKTAFYAFSLIVEMGFPPTEAPTGNAITQVSSNPFRLQENALLTVLLHLETEEEVAMSVRDLHGRVVFEEALGVVGPRRAYPWVWRGENQHGGKVAAGIYFIVARFSDGVSIEKVAVVR